MEQVKDIQKDGLDWAYIVLKIEKLTAALHLVTSFLNNSDPIKYKLRDLSLQVMNNSLPLKYTTDKYKTVGLDDLKRQIDNLASFITVALTDSSVSQMNLTILQKEYRDLYNYLDRYQVNQETLVGKVEAPRVSLPSLTPGPSPKERGENPAFALKALSFGEGLGGAASRVAPINTERRDLILTYIKAHGWSAITDIAKAVPNVSDKTVQRELVAMLNEGVLLKKGDRRWSRYLLTSRP